MPRAAATLLAPLGGARQQLDGLEHDDADQRVGDALAEHPAPREAEITQVQQFVEAHEDAGVNHRGCQKRQKPRQRPGHDELRARQPHQVAYNGLGQSADAQNPARQRVLRQPGRGARQQAGGRPRRDGDIDHDDQDQIQGRGAQHQKRREPGLQHQGQRQRDDHGQRLHRGVPAGAGGAAVVSAAWGVSTTSTSSRLVKLAAG